MKNSKDSTADQYTVVFDDECRFCNLTARILRRNDPGRRLRWVSARSEAGRALIKTRGARDTDMESILLIGPNKIERKSEAVISTLENLNAPKAILKLLKTIPGPIRDGVYDTVALNRYRLFGRISCCEKREPNDS